MFEKLKWRRMSPKEVFEKGFEAELKQGMEKALSFYEYAAEQGYAGAQYTLGKYCEHMANDTLDLKKADEYDAKTLFWYEKAAQQGYAPAQCELGDIYFYGEICEQDYEKALYWTEKAAQQDLLPALEGIGRMYAKGHGCQPDPEKAAYWDERFRRQEEAQPQQERLYSEKLFGRDVLEKYAKFDIWSTAETGNARAMYAFATMLDNGQGCTANRAEGIRWLKKAAEQNHEEAKKLLTLSRQQFFAEGRL